jgi:ribosomal protein L30E
LDYSWELRRLKETGNYVLGERTTAKMLKKGDVKAVVYCEEPHLKQKYENYNGTKFAIPMNSLQLGTIFGKPFSVSVIGVIDSGDSAFKGND